MSYKLAREKITKFIIKRKREGKIEMRIGDIVIATKIPIDMVEMVMTDFLKEGKIDWLSTNS